MSSLKVGGNYFLYILLFLFLFVPYISVGGVTLHLPYYYLTFFTLAFLFLCLDKGDVKEYFVILLVFLTPYGWTLLVSISTGIFDISMQINYLNAFLVIFGAFGMATLIVNRLGEAAGYFFIKAIYFSGVAHAAIMVLAFFVGPVRDVLYKVVILGAKGQLFIEGLYRSPGLTTGGGDTLSAMQAISFVFGLYYVVSVRKDLPFGYFLFHLAAFSLLFVSVLLSARTGLVVLFLGIMCLIARQFFLMFMRARFSSATLKKLCWLILLLVSGIPVLYSGLVTSEYSRFVHRAFELYTNFVEHGKVGTSSTDELFKMFFLPTSDTGFLFGNGNFGRDAQLKILPSDVGYVRVWFGSGIIGVVLFYAPVLFALLYLYKRARLYLLLFPLCFLVLVFFTVNIKSYHGYGSDLVFKVFFLAVSVLVSLRRTPQKTHDQSASIRAD